MYNMYNPYYRTNPFTQSQQVPQYQTPTYQPPAYQPQPSGIQGKTVDSLDVVKAMDIPLDREFKLFSLSGSVVRL